MTIMRTVVSFRNVRHKLQSLTSMTAEDLLIDDCSNRQTVEAVCECLPEFDTVSPFTLNYNKNTTVVICARP